MKGKNLDVDILLGKGGIRVAEKHTQGEKKNKGEVVDKKGRKRSRSRGVAGLMLHGFKSKTTLWPGFPSLTQRDKNQLKGAGRTIQHSVFFNEQICVIIFYCKNMKTSLKLSEGGIKPPTLGSLRVTVSEAPTVGWSIY